MKTIVGITGTTSVGKSAVAVRLAQLLGTEIISADSMQIYKGMDIGTAKITSEQTLGTKHHMIDVVEPNCNYSSYLYQQEASRIINSMHTLPIVVGGTGFYFDSLVYPPEFGTSNDERRQELQRLLATDGLQALCEILKNLDAETYATIDKQNSKRVIRAIEIAESGKLKSQGYGREKPQYNLILFVLQRSRNDLYEQIDQRVDEMIANGLVNEVKALTDKYGVCNTSAFSAIGYKEVIEYLHGQVTLDEAVAQIKLNTRHYAKRQITYYKKMNVAEFIDVDGKDSCEIAAYIFEKLQLDNVI